MKIAEYNGCVVSVIATDITSVSAGVLIAPVNSLGDWTGEIDWALRACAGEVFHSQLAHRLSRKGRQLQDGESYFAQRGFAEGGAFEDVVFVCDDWKRPLNGIVREGLWRSALHHAGTVALPVMRTGRAAGKFEQTPQEAFAKTVEGVRQYLLSASSDLRFEAVDIVVKPESPLHEHLKQSLSL